MTPNDADDDPFSRPGRKSRKAEQPALGFTPPPVPGPPATTPDAVWEGLARLAIPAPGERSSLQQQIVDLAEQVRRVEQVADDALRAAKFGAVVNAQKLIKDLRTDLARLIDIELLRDVVDELERLQVQHARAEAQGQATAAAQYRKMILDLQEKRREEERRRRLENQEDVTDDELLRDILSTLPDLSEQELEQIAHEVADLLGYDLVPREVAPDEVEGDVSEAADEDDVEEDEA